MNEQAAKFEGAINGLIEQIANEGEALVRLEQAAISSTEVIAGGGGARGKSGGISFKLKAQTKEDEALAGKGMVIG